MAFFIMFLDCITSLVIELTPFFIHNHRRQLMIHIRTTRHRSMGLLLTQPVLIKTIIEMETLQVLLPAVVVLMILLYINDPYTTRASTLQILSIKEIIMLVYAFCRITCMFVDLNCIVWIKVRVLITGLNTIEKWRKSHILLKV